MNQQEGHILLRNSKRCQLVEIRILQFLVVAFVFMSCSSKSERDIDKHDVDSVSEIMFIDYGSDCLEDSGLVIDYENSIFKITREGKEISRGKLEKRDLIKFRSLINNLKDNNLNRIFNVNSSDASLYMVKFWGPNSDYAYMINTYGMSNLPQDVDELFKVIRKSNKELGRR